MIRKNLGKGLGKGYKNIILNYDRRIHQLSAKGIKQKIRRLQIPKKLTNAKGVFRYNREDVSLDNILSLLKDKLNLQEHIDFDVAYDQNNMNNAVIFLHTDKALARVLQSYIFKNKPIRRITYAELVRDNIKIVGVS
jgi:hypothetical protein